MRIGIRLLLGYFLIVAIAGFFVLNIFVQEIKPGVRRASEDMLMDTANLLAQLVGQDVTNNTIETSLLVQAFSTLHPRPIANDLAGEHGEFAGYRVYVTNDQGIVIYDSVGQALGEDYSRWNDVYLTLRGHYGARSTRDDPDDDNSSVMYVAAPIKAGDKIVGSLTVAKPNRVMMPIIRRSELHMQIAGFFLLGIALLIGIVFVWWITHSILRLVQYAREVADGKPAVLPKLENSELTILADAIEKMRIKLEGKDYIEAYVHTLTHELKSPLAAIRGAAEILQESPPEEVKQRFLSNIEQQSERIQLLVDRMLRQASVESRIRVEFLRVDLRKLLQEVVLSKEAQAATLDIQLINQVNINMQVKADSLLLSQAITNLLDNAFDFTPKGGTIRITARRLGNQYQVSIIDSGCGIPDYALGKVFDRFYSLPRPNKGKSTGLGLSFVREVATLHKGYILLENANEGGAKATFIIPRYV